MAISNLSKKILLHLYEKEKLTTSQIAEKMNCCQATIWKRLKEYGIASRLPGTERVNLDKKTT